MSHFMIFSMLLSMPLIAAAPFGSAHAAAAEQARSLTEVPVRNVLFPPTGYDDNDHVMVRITGEMPDRCFVLGTPSVTEEDGGRTLIVHQFAWTRGEGAPCSPERGPHDPLGVPYSQDVSLGKLGSGAYRVGRNYARVDSVVVPSRILRENRVTATLAGTFASSCNRLVSPISVRRTGDVIVVEPIELQLGDCGWSLNFFERSVDLGRLPPGEYLLHVRAAGGVAVQKTFEVVDNQKRDIL